jgi:PKD repeat protein
MLYRWDGGTWCTLGTGYKLAVRSLIEYNDELLVGGYITHINDTVRSPGFARWHLPYNYNCNALQPRIHTVSDTVYLDNGSVEVSFFNNNAYSPYWQWDFGDTGTGSVQNPMHTYSDTGTFTVSVTVAHDVCTKTAIKQITVLNPNSINEIRITNCQLRIYPNPSDSQFTIETKIPQGSNGEIKVYGIRGEYKSEIPITTGKNTNILNVNSWQKGNYLCGLYVDGKMAKMERLVVE